MKRLIQAAVGIAAVVVIAASANIFYKKLNHAELTVAQATDLPASEYVGYKSIAIKQGQPVDIGYSVADWNGLEKVTIILNEEQIHDDTYLDGKGVAKIIPKELFDLKPGAYRIELILRDKKGQERRDRAYLTVKDEVYKF